MAAFLCVIQDGVSPCFSGSCMSSAVLDKSCNQILKGERQRNSRWSLPICGLKWYSFLKKSRSNIQVQAPQKAGKLENILQSLKISIWVRMVSRQLWAVSPGGNKTQTEAQLSAQRICLCKEEP